MQGLGRIRRQDCLKFIAGLAPTAPSLYYAAMSSAVIADDASGLAEPTIGTGNYTPPNIAWTSPPLPTAGQPAVLGNSGTVDWGASSAAWSNTANMIAIGVFNHATTRTESFFIGAMGVTVPRAVAAAGITLESLAGDLQFTLTPT